MIGFIYQSDGSIASDGSASELFASATVEAIVGFAETIGKTAATGTATASLAACFGEAQTDLLWTMKCALSYNSSNVRISTFLEFRRNRSKVSRLVKLATLVESSGNSLPLFPIKKMIFGSIVRILFWSRTSLSLTNFFDPLDLSQANF